MGFVSNLYMLVTDRTRFLDIVTGFFRDFTLGEENVSATVDRIKGDLRIPQSRVSMSGSCTEVFLKRVRNERGIFFRQTEPCENVIITRQRESVKPEQCFLCRGKQLQETCEWFAGQA